MSSYITGKTPGDTAWYTHDRFGMVLHIGLFSLFCRGAIVKEHGSGCAPI